ncbi:hypothetical protein E2562_027684 [Oryza meyeriana var. granulata]|uniref:Uncharacterized protein n=1 Tax=Oryza meyeriana var. granulata TaxID=110450 RepID=A0A6G1CTI1_9ORYZ|nr:hypothetical protein E2562_027684 [Oryza meyeriana var. granulata]
MEDRRWRQRRWRLLRQGRGEVVGKGGRRVRRICRGSGSGGGAAAIRVLRMGGDRGDQCAPRRRPTLEAGGAETLGR